MFVESCRGMCNSEYVNPAVLEFLDPNQYGAVPKSSTTQALINMLHNWAKGTDGNSGTVRTILFDYKKLSTLQTIELWINYVG